MSIFSNPLRIRSSGGVLGHVDKKGVRLQKTLADLVRSPVLYQVAPGSLDTSKDERENDDYFLKLYLRYLDGKLLGAWTRVNITTIVPGFFRRATDGTIKYVEEHVDSGDVDNIDLHRGFRPALVLYRGIFGESEKKLICCDDVTAYLGYQRAGITQVPAMILGKPKNLFTESAICTRVDKNDRQARFDSTFPLLPKGYQTILGDNEALKRYDFTGALRTLIRTADSAASTVRKFHIVNGEHDTDVVHYHQTLHSVAFRVGESLRAIELLFERGLAHQLRPLVRSLYELFLNFYLDWLCPEQVGPLLQSLALLKRLPPNSAEAQSLKKSVDSTYKGLADVCGNASAKANLSPLGMYFYGTAYPVLSQIVHQDFGVTHEYMMTLEAGAPTNWISRNYVRS